MEAGKLNCRITIQEKTVSYDSYNQPIETWNDKDTIWAEIITSGGSEFYAAQKVNALTQAVIRVRFTKSISVLNRIKYGTRIFEILAAPDPDAKRVELLISAKEVV